MQMAVAQGNTSGQTVAWPGAHGEGGRRGECVLQPVAPKAWQPRQGQAVAQADQSQGQRPTGSATGFGSERNLSGFTVD